MKRLRWQILVVAVTLVIVALLLLSQTPVTTITLPEAAPGGIYTEALIGSMGRLNPMLDWNNSADRDVNRLIFSGLVKFDSRGLPQPDLVESWGVSADGKVYNFSLRPNAVWHDGQPVSPQTPSDQEKVIGREMALQTAWLALAGQPPKGAAE